MLPYRKPHPWRKTRSNVTRIGRQRLYSLHKKRQLLQILDLDGIDEPEPLDVEVFQNPVDGKQMVAEEEITPAPVPPEVMGEPDLPQIEFPELPPQIESRNPADQPSRKSNRRHKKPERFGHNIYD